MSQEREPSPVRLQDKDAPCDICTESGNDPPCPSVFVIDMPEVTRDDPHLMPWQSPEPATTINVCFCCTMVAKIAASLLKARLNARARSN